MPELPEVETIKRGLETRIVGLRLEDIDVLTPKTAHFGPGDYNNIIGAKVEKVRRRAKVLIWDLSSGWSLMFHLKMTGQIIVDSEENRFAGGHPTKSMSLKSSLPDNSTRIVFSLNRGAVVYFNDQRKFGWVKLVKTQEVEKDVFLSTVGPEPHGPDFNVDEFKKQIKNRRVSIKAVLLDQKVVAGIGNIYADEALHMAKIHPERSATTLKTDEIQRLYDAVKVVLQDSIERGGTSFTNYVNVEGVRGDYLQHARVFKREGHACQECGSEILKTRVAGRGTHYCPTCQPRR